MACDILSLEWISNGRDIHIVEPVLCYLEKEYNLKVVRDSIWYGEYKLIKYKPKMLIIANAVGASNNFNITKLAHKLGIVTVEMVSEGVYAKPTNQRLADQMFWGWNRDKVLYSDMILYWSNAMKDNFKGFINDSILEHIKISGATGFDRYKLFKFMDKQEFLNNRGKENYKKVVGIAGWAFDRYIVQDGILDNGPLDMFSEGERKFFREGRNQVSKIYRDLISNNQDTLFILKYHPAIYDKELSEFAGLSRYNNVIEIINEETIENLLNISDLWLCYESTTVIEAWLLNKQTIFVNPDINFVRSELYLGSAIAKNSAELKDYVKTYFDDGDVPTFSEKECIRKKIVGDVIGFDDGKNHVRAAKAIMSIYKKKEGHKESNIDGFVLYILAKAGIRKLVFKTPLKLLFYKKYKLIRPYELAYSIEERRAITNRYYQALMDDGNKQDKSEATPYFCQDN